MEAPKALDTINKIRDNNVMFKGKTDKGNNIHLHLKNINDDLNILIYILEFHSKYVYEKSFSLKTIQENDYFKENYTINDIIDEILSINQYRTINYIEKEKSISVIIPLSFKTNGKEIIFEVNQRIKTTDDKFNELYELIDYKSYDKKLDNIEYILTEMNKKFNIQIEEYKKKICELENELKEKNKIIEENNKILLKYKNSKIINEEEFKMISDWINPNCRYEFNLIYNSERDGDSISTMHKLVDGKGPTLFLIKSDNNYIFGGYAFDSWNSNSSWLNNSNDFIFSITNKKKYPKNTSDSYGICGSNSGFHFGGGNDIFLSDGFCSSNKSYTNLSSYKPGNGMQSQYELNGGTQYFKVIKFEVYTMKNIS